MEQLLTELQKIIPLSDELELRLRKTAVRHEFKKRYKLTRPGQVCNRLYYVEKGILRLYVKSNNKEYSNWFMLEGDFATSVTSFFGNAPSLETIEVAEDCILWSVSRQELEDIYEQWPAFRKVGQRLTERYYCLDNRMKIYLMTMDKQEFYDYLVKERPNLVDRVPRKYLASFMGITVQSLPKTKR